MESYILTNKFFNSGLVTNIPIHWWIMFTVAYFSCHYGFHVKFIVAVQTTNHTNAQFKVQKLSSNCKSITVIKQNYC